MTPRCMSVKSPRRTSRELRIGGRAEEGLHLTKLAWPGHEMSWSRGGASSPEAEERERAEEGVRGSAGFEPRPLPGVPGWGWG